MTLKRNLPTMVECTKYMASLNYDKVGKVAGAYIFRDNTNKRPLHVREMFWTLGELRHAFKYGW